MSLERFFFLLVIGFFAGCSSGPELPHFRRYTMEVFPSKPAGYRVPVLYDRPSEPFVFIGRFSCFGVGHTGSELMEAAQAKARQVGADALVVYSNEVVTGGDHGKCDTDGNDNAPGEFDASSDATDASGESRGERKFDVEMIAYKRGAPGGR